MIPRVGKVERIQPTRSSTDNPSSQMSQSHQQNLESQHSQNAEGPVKKLILRNQVEISPEARRLYELSKRTGK